MNNTDKTSFFHSKKFKESMKFVYGFGGAIVILGAMFKITHWPGATEMLVAGLTTEALIFILSAFEPLPADGHESAVATPYDSVDDESFGKMQLNPETLQQLSEGIQALAKQTEAISEMVQLQGSIQKFGSALEHAAEVLEKQSHKAGKQIEKIASSSEEFAEVLEKAAEVDLTIFQEKITFLQEHLSEVQEIYQGQVKNLSEGFTVNTESKERFDEGLENLEQVAKQAMIYQENLAQLGEKIERLNTVYQEVLDKVESELPEERKGIFESLFGFFTNKK